jgi:hypothetical protein
MERDILTQLVDYYWDWIAEFHPALLMLILRWGFILILLLAFGIAIRCLHPRWGAHSLAAQIGAVVLALLIAFAIPVAQMTGIAKGPRNTWITLALIMWMFFPYFLPHLLIRRLGLQSVVRYALYGIEVFLIATQVILNAWS